MVVGFDDDDDRVSGSSKPSKVGELLRDLSGDDPVEMVRSNGADGVEKSVADEDGPLPPVIRFSGF